MDISTSLKKISKMPLDPNIFEACTDSVIDRYLNSDIKSSKDAIYGVFCRSFYVRGFVEDVFLIAGDFFRAEGENIRKYYMNKNWVSEERHESTSSYYIVETFINILLNAYLHGSKNAKNLLITIYQTYFPEEYSRLHSLKKVTDRLFEKNDDDNLMARLFVMSEVMDIPMDPKTERGCYFCFDDIFKSVFAPKCESIEYGNYIDNVVEKYPPLDIPRRNLATSKKVLAFEKKILNTCGFSHKLPYLGLDIDFDIDEENLIIDKFSYNASVILKDIFPDKEFDSKEICFYAHILVLLCSFMYTSDLLKQGTYSFMAGVPVDMFGSEETKYIPKEFKPTEIKVEKEEKLTEKPEKITDVEREKYEQEIKDLRLQLKQKDMDINYMSAEREKLKTVEEERDQLKSEIENDKKELAALRKHLYDISNSDYLEQDLSDDDIKDKIRDKNIIIIGGHTNWLKKLRDVFPSWRFIDASVTGTISNSILFKADYIFFFTDTISHSTYFKYMNVVKEHNLPFGYIHDVNISNTLKCIYRELEDILKD